MIYLDNAATTYKKPIMTYEAMARYTITTSVNAGRGGHYLSLKGAEGIMDTEDQIAELFNIKNSTRIAFTQNATYALNMAIMGTVQKGEHVIVTSMDHNSVLRPVNAKFEYTVVNADSKGLVHLEDIKKAVKPNTRLIAMTHISNVCGTIQPVYEIGAYAKSKNILFLLDAAQSAGCVDIDAQAMNLDMIAFSGHKGLMGPLGTGGLYVKENVNIRPVIFGGTGSNSESLAQPNFMPDALQSGTMNTPAIMALGKSIEYIKKHSVYSIGEKERYLAIRLIEKLKNMPGVVVYGLPNGPGRNGTVAFNINNIESSTVAENLNDNYEIAVRGGWHCAYLAHKTLGSEKTGAVRASFGFFNKEKDADLLADALWKIISK